MSADGSVDGAVGEHDEGQSGPRNQERRPCLRKRREHERQSRRLSTEGQQREVVLTEVMLFDGLITSRDAAFRGAASPRGVTCWFAAG